MHAAEVSGPIGFQSAERNSLDVDELKQKQQKSSLQPKLQTNKLDKLIVQQRQVRDKLNSERVKISGWQEKRTGQGA